MKDGRLSIEQQLQIFLEDLLSYLDPSRLSASTSPRPDVSVSPPITQDNTHSIRRESLDLRGVHEVLAGLEYVVDYRIRGGRQPNLDPETCERLMRLLMLISGYRKSDKGEQLFKRKKHKQRQSTNIEADTAFGLVFSLMHEVVECGRALGSISVAEVRQSMKFHLRILDAGSTSRLESALLALFTLTKELPQFGDWRELVKAKHQQEVYAALQGAGFFDAEQQTVWRRLISEQHSAQLVALKAPQGLHADREVARVLDMFRTNIERGLDSKTVDENAAWYGPNEVARPPSKSVWRMLIGQLADFMIGILVLASIGSFAVDWPDPTTFLILLLVVIINVAIGLVQEWKASRAVESIVSAGALQSRTTRVLRDGVEQSIASASLVPGDIVLLAEGDSVPADLRLAVCTRFACIESMLTGESEAVSKSSAALRVKSRRLPLTKCTGNAFMGTMAARGNAVGIVVRIGGETGLGRISAAITSSSSGAGDERRTSELKQQLSRLARILVAIAVVLCLLVAIAGIVWGSAPSAVIKVAVSLAVSVIPEGLLAVMTVCMALSMSRLAKRHGAIVRHSTAIEQLARLDILCCDKTGTLTEGRMKVEQSWFIPPQPHSIDEFREGERVIRECAALCNNIRWSFKDGKAALGGGDTTELALLQFALQHPPLATGLSGCTRLLEIPFDSDRKMMSVVVQQQQTETTTATCMLYAKGAPEVIMERCIAHHTGLHKGLPPSVLDQSSLRSISEAQVQMSEQGLRILGLAIKYDIDPRSLPKQDDEAVPGFLEQDLVFVGLVGIADPPRQGIQQVIRDCHSLGCSVAMITGDHAETAIAIARQLGILPANTHGESPFVMRGRELDALGEEGLARMRPHPVVYARASPQNKLQIVRALQQRRGVFRLTDLPPLTSNVKQGRVVVAMTGDGVNDAPAISAADVGIAMGGPSAADICRHAASLVLPDDNVAAIPAAIREGRRAVANIAKFTAYLMACNSAEIWTVAVPVAVCNLPAPLSAINILWANIIADIPPSMALGAGEPSEEEGVRIEADLESSSPRRHAKQDVLDVDRLFLIISQGVVMAGSTLAVYFDALRRANLFSQIIFTRHAPIPDADLLAVRSEAFFVLTSLQLLIVFAFKSLDQSIFTRSPLDNVWLILSVALSFALLILGHYTPGLRDTLELQPLGLRSWAKMAIAALILLLSSELVKLFTRCRRRRAIKEPSLQRC